MLSILLKRIKKNEKLIKRIIIVFVTFNVQFAEFVAIFGNWLSDASVLLSKVFWSWPVDSIYDHSGVSLR